MRNFHSQFLKRMALKKFDKTWIKLEKHQFLNKIQHLLRNDEEILYRFSKNREFYKIQQIFLGLKRKIEFFFSFFLKFQFIKYKF